MDRVHLNEDAYKCIAQQMGVVGSYPKWEELVTGVATHFSVPVFGGWLAPVRHAFIEAEIPDGDTIYTQILKAFEYLTSSDPLTLWPSSDTIEKAELQFRHVEDGWFEVNLKRCRTRLQTRHLPTAQNCEARVKELAQTARCLRRTKHVLSRAHLFTIAALPECIRSERQGREERDGVKKRRTYRNVISKTLREELNYSLCVVAEELEKEGAAVDWISVLNLCEKRYNANGPKQYGTSLLSYLDSYGERLRVEMETEQNEELQASEGLLSYGRTLPCSQRMTTNSTPSTTAIKADAASNRDSTCTMEEDDNKETVPCLRRKRGPQDCKASYHTRRAISSCVAGEADVVEEEESEQGVCSVRQRKLHRTGELGMSVETRSSSRRKVNRKSKDNCGHDQPQRSVLVR